MDEMAEKDQGLMMKRALARRLAQNKNVASSERSRTTVHQRALYRGDKNKGQTSDCSIRRVKRADGLEASAKATQLNRSQHSHDSLRKKGSSSTQKNQPDGLKLGGKASQLQRSQRPYESSHKKSSSFSQRDLNTSGTGDESLISPLQRSGLRSSQPMEYNLDSFALQSPSNESHFSHQSSSPLHIGSHPRRRKSGEAGEKRISDTVFSSYSRQLRAGQSRPATSAPAVAFHKIQRQTTYPTSHKGEWVAEDKSHNNHQRVSREKIQVKNQLLSEDRPYSTHQRSSSEKMHHMSPWSSKDKLYSPRTFEDKTRHCHYESSILQSNRSYLQSNESLDFAGQNHHSSFKQAGASSIRKPGLHGSFEGILGKGAKVSDRGKTKEQKPLQRKARAPHEEHSSGSRYPRRDQGFAERKSPDQIEQLLHELKDLGFDDNFDDELPECNTMKEVEEVPFHDEGKRGLKSQSSKKQIDVLAEDEEVHPKSFAESLSKYNSTKFSSSHLATPYFLVPREQNSRGFTKDVANKGERTYSIESDPKEEAIVKDVLFSEVDIRHDIQTEATQDYDSKGSRRNGDVKLGHHEEDLKRFSNALLSKNLEEQARGDAEILSKLGSSDSAHLHSARQHCASRGEPNEEHSSELEQPRTHDQRGLEEGFCCCQHPVVEYHVEERESLYQGLGQEDIQSSLESSNAVDGRVQRNGAERSDQNQLSSAPNTILETGQGDSLDALQQSLEDRAVGRNPEEAEENKDGDRQGVQETGEDSEASAEERERLLQQIALLQAQQNDSLRTLLVLRLEQFWVRHQQMTTLMDIIQDFGQTMGVDEGVPNDIRNSLNRMSLEVLLTLQRLLQYAAVSMQQASTALTNAEQATDAKGAAQEAIDALATFHVTENSDICGQVCPICLSKYKSQDCMRHLPCSHEFHQQCVDAWLKVNDTCPNCRISISSNNPPQQEERVAESNSSTLSDTGGTI